MRIVEVESSLKSLKSVEIGTTEYKELAQVDSEDGTRSAVAVWEVIKTVQWPQSIGSVDLPVFASAEAKPQLENPATALLANYHEKLLVLDSAIGELRAQAGLNPSNAQLRYQLLAMYQEKQRTLEEVLETKQ